jgi:hypothetical protein
MTGENRVEREILEKERNGYGLHFKSLKGTEIVGWVDQWTLPPQERI